MACIRHTMLTTAGGNGFVGAERVALPVWRHKGGEDVGHGRCPSEATPTPLPTHHATNPSLRHPSCRLPLCASPPKPLLTPFPLSPFLSSSSPPPPPPPPLPAHELEQALAVSPARTRSAAADVLGGACVPDPATSAQPEHAHNCALQWLSKAVLLAHGWGLHNLGTSLQLAEVCLGGREGGDLMRPE